VLDQAKDLGLREAELEDLWTQGDTSGKPVAPGGVAVVLDNKAPFYTIHIRGTNVHYGATTITFQSGKEAKYKFLSRHCKVS